MYDLESVIFLYKKEKIEWLEHDWELYSSERHDCPGIYILVEDTGSLLPKIKYVGQSINISQRIRGHHIVRRYNKENSNRLLDGYYIYVMPINEDYVLLLDMIESILIGLFEPELNTAHYEYTNNLIKINKAHHADKYYAIEIQETEGKI